MFLVGCKKNNHDTIIHIGNESYKQPIEAIYPENYRSLWRTVAPTCSNKVYEGIFPPDLSGVFEMRCDYRGSNEMINQGGVYIDFITPANLAYYGIRYLYLLIEEQQNGIAKLRFKTQYRNALPQPYNYDTWNSVDTAYIWGSGEDGNFTLCFESWLHMGSKNYKNGFIVNGKMNIPEDGSPCFISDAEFWSVIKQRDPDYDQPGIMKLDGQSMYFCRRAEKKE